MTVIGHRRKQKDFTTDSPGICPPPDCEGLCVSVVCLGPWLSCRSQSVHFSIVHKAVLGNFHFAFTYYAFLRELLSLVCYICTISVATFQGISLLLNCGDDITPQLKGEDLFQHLGRHIRSGASSPKKIWGVKHLISCILVNFMCKFVVEINPAIKSVT